MDLYPQTGVLLTPERLIKTEEFLNKMGLRYEGGADYTVQLLSEYGEIVGTGSLCGNVLKYIAIDERLQGEGAALTLVSELVSEAYRRGVTKLFLFTKAANEMLFRGVGFYTVAATRDVCFMENTRSGFSGWLASLERHEGVVGAAVMNCNPFTRGHRYLIEEAAKQADRRRGVGPVVVLIAVARPAVGGDLIGGEVDRLFHHHRIDRKPPHAPAFERHHLPAGHGGVPRLLLGEIPPPSHRRVLRILNKGGGLLRRTPESLVAFIVLLGPHRARFAQGNRGQAV